MSAFKTVLRRSALFSLFLYSVTGEPCLSFGTDFTDKGSFFQNSNSSDKFTFVHEFSGDCRNDQSQNLLVNPAGDQLQCSDTPLLPVNTPELSTCPINKKDLASGPWSIVVLSNNLDGEPLAWQRDFILTVAPQQTTLYTPTVTVPTTITPQVNMTQIVTDVSTLTVTPSTVMLPAVTQTPPPYTITPKKVTTTVVKVLRTIHMTKPTIVVTKVTKDIAASCSLPPRRQQVDKKATIQPTAARAASLAVLVTASAAPAAPAAPAASPPPPNNAGGTRRARFGRKIALRELEDLPSWLAKRDQYLAEAGEAVIVKRAPDLPVVTSTEANTALYSTAYQTITNPAVTNVITETNLVTSTLTPPPVTMVSGTTVLPRVTITAPTPTRVITRHTIAWNISTKTFTYTVTITNRPTPQALKDDCRRQGGVIR